MKSEKVKVLDLVANGTAEEALMLPSILKVLEMRGIEVADLNALLGGSISQRNIAYSLIVSLTNSPFFKEK